MDGWNTTGLSIVLQDEVRVWLETRLHEGGDGCLPALGKLIRHGKSKLLSDVLKQLSF